MIFADNCYQFDGSIQAKNVRPPILLDSFSCIPDRVALGAPLGSSPVCFGSVSSRLRFTGDKAALARSVSSGACPVAFSTLFVSYFPFSVCVKPGASLLHFSPQLGLVNWRDLSLSLFKKWRICFGTVVLSRFPRNSATMGDEDKCLDVGALRAWTNTFRCAVRLPSKGT